MEKQMIRFIRTTYLMQHLEVCKSSLKMTQAGLHLNRAEDGCMATVFRFVNCNLLKTNAQFTGYMKLERWVAFFQTKLFIGIMMNFQFFFNDEHTWDMEQLCYVICFTINYFWQINFSFSELSETGCFKYKKKDKS